MKSRTLIKLLVGVLVIGGGVGYFMYQAMQSSWSYYYSVDEFTANTDAVRNSSLRLAGVVKTGSVARNIDDVMLTFVLAGAKSEVPVQYRGTVPDNFTEDIEVVVDGQLNTGGVFEANVLTTRCESKYKAKVD